MFMSIISKKEGYAYLLKNYPQCVRWLDSELFVVYDYHTNKWIAVADGQSIPPYSPDLAPTDSHLFSDMQRFLEGTDFKTISDVENWLVSYFASKKPEFWRTGTMSLQNRWQTVVDKEVKYR
uniref:Uncharacterized protein n=1 Tax=Caenorhabditis japonica TaxID=281687 RepID=A0A8R1DI25_CAEJA